MISRRIATLLLAVCAIMPAAAQQKKFDFTIKNIMRGPELYGREPQNVRWTLDGKWIYFNWLEAGSDWRLNARQFRVRAERGAKPERVSQAQMDSVALQFEPGRLSPDGKSRLLVVGGDVALIDIASGQVHRLTQTVDAESSPIFSADGREVLFLRANNVYALSLTGGLLRQLTDIRTADQAATGGSAVPVFGGGRGGRGGQGGGAATGRGATDSLSSSVAAQRSSLQRQQRELFEVIKDQAWRDSVARAEGGGRGGRGGGGGGRGGRGGGAGGGGGDVGAADPMRARTITLRPNERVNGLSISPTGTALVLSAATAGTAPLGTIVPSWVTASGYVEEINGRSKVGDVSSSSRLLFLPLPNGPMQPLSVGGPNNATANARVIGWNDAGTSAIVVSNSDDNKYRWYYTVGADGSTKLVETVHDSAWVGGPCGQCVGWYDGGKRFYFVNESDGWAHLYTMAADGSDRKQLTSGTWEVLSVELSKDKQSFYIESSEPTPLERHFYRMSVNGGAREKITSVVGGHNITMSPDETMIADVFSTSNRPPDLFIAPNKAGGAMSQLTQSASAEFLSFNWIKAPIVMVPASDGKQVPTRIFKPQDMGAKPNGAAVVFVHGAGYLHNVMNYWTSSYPREWMYNQYLASKGYVVIDMDYRASAGWGRDWRTAIYRWMGGRDLQDQVDGVKYLQKNYGIDPERVGIYGGSYGGFITLMALFTEPKYFGAGGALRSVTDWAHYNHGYTSPILNLPETDTLAYRRSSPIYFAQGLEDPLIMFHGMVDTNVEFEDIVRLTQRLIELGKKGWQLAPYPVEDHGFVRPDSWTDEYSRMFDLFESTIRVGSKKLTTPGAR